MNWKDTLFGRTREAYRPKFCRTRGCSLKFEHDGPCGAVIGDLVPFAGRRVRDRVTGKSRPVRTGQRGRATVSYDPRRSPKAAPVPGTADRMAHYRRRPVNANRSAS